MISASILAIGLVLVARGLLTASSILQTVDNRISAYMFLHEKLMTLQQEAMEQGGLSQLHDAGAAQFGGRPISWALDVEPLNIALPAVTLNPPAAQAAGASGAGSGSIEGVTAQEAAGAGQAPGQEAPHASFAQVTLRADWRENNRAQDAVLMTYVAYKAPPGEPAE